ncbi:MAG: hypothetical protein E6J41_25325 [Chloroflexi bacterium]|nr:MAG: hypothetical protein E6J41_25325 [Chloroflexota bacterium]
MARALSDYPELARYMDGPGRDPRDVHRIATSAPPRRGPRPGGATSGPGTATPAAEEESITNEEMRQNLLPDWKRAAEWMAREAVEGYRHDAGERGVQAEHFGRIVRGRHVHDAAHARQAYEREEAEAER